MKIKTPLTEEDMAWFKRTKKGIQTATEDKKDVPKGLWYKSPTGKIVDSEAQHRNFCMMDFNRNHFLSEE